jgi:hypothetical protein
VTAIAIDRRALFREREAARKSERLGPKFLEAAGIENTPASIAKRRRGERARPKVGAKLDVQPKPRGKLRGAPTLASKPKNQGQVWNVAFRAIADAIGPKNAKERSVAFGEAQFRS